MLTVKKEGIILTSRSLPFESEAVLNPAVSQDGDSLFMFYRAIGKDNNSSIGFCKLNGPLTIAEKLDTPLLFPDMEIESKGMEDPRIVKINELYYLTYTAYDGVNAMGALATSSNLKQFTKHGLIVPAYSYPEFSLLAERSGKLNTKYKRFAHDKTVLKQNKKVLIWDKDLMFFPRRIKNKLCFLHRIKPDIQFTAVNEISDLTKEFWDNYLLDFKKHIVMSPKYDHEVSYIGGGCPPVETSAGWLIIYHGVHDTTNGYVYSACAALLDLENPVIEIARLPYPLFKPEADWELKGDVNNVCFPSGSALYGDTLYIYYGAADKCIGCASTSLSALVNELLRHKKSISGSDELKKK